MTSLSRIFILLIIVTAFVSCKKEKERYCWQLVDNLGNDLTQICDKTEQELLDCTDCGSFNGQSNVRLGDVMSSCNYFNTSDPVYCWVIARVYQTNRSEKYVQCRFPGQAATKVACDPTCDNWFTRQKLTYKPDNSVQYSSILSKRIYCGDTAAIFRSQAEFVIKNTTDSLILLQYSQDGYRWY